jgi:hypothetical protein
MRRRTTKPAPSIPTPTRATRPASIPVYGRERPPFAAALPEPVVEVVDPVDVAATALGVLLPPLLPLAPLAVAPEPEFDDPEPEPECDEPPPPPPECPDEPPPLHPASGSQYCWSPAPVAKAVAGLSTARANEAVRISFISFDIRASMTNAAELPRTWASVRLG